MRRLWAAVLASLLLGAAFPPRGGTGASSGLPIVSVVPNSYVLPTTASTNVGSGVVTTTFADGSSTTSAPLTITSSGTSADGANCASSPTQYTAPTDFDVSSNTLKTSGTYPGNLEWDYVCITSSPIGHLPFTQLIALKRNSGASAHMPQHTAVVAVGDTNTTGSWQYPTYLQMLGGDYGWSIAPPGAGPRGTGDAMTACNAMIGTIISDATGTIAADYRTNPAYLLNFGTYEAQNYSESTYGQTFVGCLKAAARWLTVSNKQLAPAASTTGTWTDYTATGLSAGTCKQSSDVSTPASITFTVNVVAGIFSGGEPTYANGAAYLWWGAISAAGTGNSGLTLTYSVDGGSALNLVPNNYQSSVGIQTIYVHELTHGSHTIKLTLPGSFGATGVTGIVACAAGTPPLTWADKVELAGVPPLNPDTAATAAYDLDVANIQRDLAVEQLDVVYAPTRNYVVSPGDFVDATHLNATGQAHLAQALSENLYKCLYGAATPYATNSLSAGYTCPILISNASTNSVYTYPSGSLKPVPGYNWYSSGKWPGGPWDPAGINYNLFRSGPNVPMSHAQLGDGCCTLTYSSTATGFIDDGAGGGSYDGVAGNVLTVTSGGNVNGGATISGSGMTMTRVIGVQAVVPACGTGANRCTVAVAQAAGPSITMTATYTGQSFVPTADTGSGSNSAAVPASICGVPVGSAAGTPPFIVGHPYGGGYYAEARVDYPQGSGLFWSESSLDVTTNNTPVTDSNGLIVGGFSVPLGLPAFNFIEHDYTDNASSSNNFRFFAWVSASVSSSNNVYLSGQNGTFKQSGELFGVMAENPIDAGGTGIVRLYGSNGSSAGSSIDPDLWKTAWLQNHCVIAGATVSPSQYGPLVIESFYVWERPL